MNKIINMRPLTKNILKNTCQYHRIHKDNYLIYFSQNYQNYADMHNKVIYNFCKDKDKIKSKQTYKEQNPKNKTKFETEQRLEKQLASIKEKDNYILAQLEQSQENYKIIQRKFNQTKVPGLQNRKYSGLSKIQQQVIQANKFDLFNPQIVPKTGALNSYVGINQKLTQISLGQVKVKGKHQAFLSQIDAENIPADLDIRFDQQKQLKVVGRQTNRQQTQKNQNQNQLQMKIQPETIQQKTMNQHMEQQFGIGIKGYRYSNWKHLRRWDIFLSLLLFSLLIPFQQTLRQLRECYKSTKAIEDQRMKQIVLLKQRSFQKVLLQKEDFNKTQ